ncbi:MAG: ABC transporter ATP-binding protein, partial [Oscillospiraceae bacterium]|nr:ABC transporter ATP-binding protein [Oscillospiraceae bacterium]
MINIKGLSKIYNTGAEQIHALDSVALDIEKGEFVAIMGTSGSGKSTLLHMIGGIDKPTRGQIIINQLHISTLSESSLAEFRRRNIGFIYQFYNLIQALNVEENITLSIMLDKQKVDEDQLQEILSTTALTQLVKRLPNQLSGGQQQRVSIARALMGSPSIILADEPTGNLDSKNSNEIIELLKLSNTKYGRTVVMVTHDERIAQQANRI